MKNNFITKIIGATLAFAMMIGGAVGINAAKEAKEVNAADGDSPIVLDGSSLSLTSTATSSEVSKTYGGVTYKVSSGAKTQSSSGSNKFNANSAILIGKSGAYIYNSTALPGTITKLEVFANSGASTKVSVGVKFATSAITTWNATGAWTATLSTLNHVYDASSAIVSGANYFRYQVTNANNSQVQIRITYTAGGGGGTPTTYSVNYADGGATSGTAPEDNTSYENNATVTVLGNTGNLAKTDYTFGGWTDGENAYQPGDTFSISSNKELTPIWNLDDGIDVLNKAFTGSPSSYTDWSNKTGASGAVYAGNSSGDNDSIQLRSNNNNSGVITTTSGGNIKKVSVIWESHTQSGRTLNVYGKNTAFTSASDLYSANSQGTLLGSIEYGESISLTISGDYRYVGVRSDDGAMYLNELHFKWEAVQLNPRVEFSPASLTLKTNQTAGAQVTALVEDVETPTYSWVANDNNVVLENANTATVTIKPNTNVAADSTVTLTVGGVTPNLVETLNVTIEIPEPGETAGTAYSVTEAKAALAAAANDLENVYITGIISNVESVNLSTHKATYWISEDGTTSNQLKVYNGKYVDNADFTSGDQVIVGDEVIVFGNFSKEYNSLNSSKIISIDLAPRVTSVTLTPAAVTVDLGSDGNIADLFTNIAINQETGSNKTANDIVWTSDDNDVFAVINDTQYIAGDTHRSSTTIHAFLNRKEFASATVNVFDANAQTINYNLPEEWRIVTDPSTLVAGDQVILTGIKADVLYAAGTYASGNNVKADTGNAISETNGVVTGVVDTMIYTLVAGTEEGSVAFKDSNDKYLCAVSSSDNYMKVQDTINGNSSFILNADGTVVAQGSYSRKYMRYNNTGTSNLFSCYASDSSTGDLVTFYKYSTGTAELDLFNLAAIQSAHEDENGAYINLGASLSAEDWAAIDSAFGIAGYGVMLIRETTLETTGFDTIEELFNSESANKSKLANLGKDSDTAPQDYSIEAKINITNESNRSVVFCAATYVKADSGAIYFINETRGSLVGLL